MIPSHLLKGQVYEVPYTPVPLIIDGHMDFSYNKTPWSAYWSDIVTEEQGKYNTNFKALWDHDNLYFFFRVFDKDIIAKGTVDHEPLFSFDNVIEIFLDAGADQLDYYELQVNAIGTKWELTIDKPYKDGGAARSPDPLEGLEYSINLSGTINDSEDTDEYWTLEVSIPWSSLSGVSSVPPKKEFKANFSRVFHDDDDNSTDPIYWLWQPIGEFNIHMPDRWGTLTFKKD